MDLEHNFLLHQRTPTSCLLPKGLSPCASRSTGKKVKRSHLPLALIFLVYQEIVRLRLLHPRRPRCSYLGRDNHGWNHCKKSLHGEQESNFYSGFSCDYPVPTSCNWVSEDGGDQDTISRYTLPIPSPPPPAPPPQKKRQKKKWALGDDGFNLISPQSTDKVPESGDETDSVRVIGNCRNCQDFTDPGLLKIRLTLTGGLSAWFCLQIVSLSHLSKSLVRWFFFARR